MSSFTTNPISNLASNTTTNTNSTTNSNTNTNTTIPTIAKVHYDAMDDYNKKAMDVLTTKGMDAAIQHMFTDQDTGRTLSYGEMRARYG